MLLLPIDQYESLLLVMIAGSSIAANKDVLSSMGTARSAHARMQASGQP